LERQTALENSMDPTGKQWVIHGKKGSALVHARPNPDRTDAVIPKEFEGQWTSPTVLREKLTIWLNRQWDKSDEIARKNALKAGRKTIVEVTEVEEPKQTPEESLAALDPEIAEELGDVIAVAKEETVQVDPKPNKPKPRAKKSK
jgi:hypothetical protein